MDHPLTGKRILIVEDEYFIASELKHVLKKQGAIVVGPVADLSGGLALAACEQLDGAVLDVNLEGAQTFPIADQLAERMVPYVFMTGYDAWALPEAYRGSPRLAKPVSMASLISTIEQLIVEEESL